MPRVAYSEADKVRIRQQLLEVGLDKFSQKGCRKVRIEDILQEVGISKPFFYTFFPSKEELILSILEYQRERLYRLAQETLADPSRGWEEKLGDFLVRCLHAEREKLFIMTQEEEIYVYKHLRAEYVQAFQNGQVEFYDQLLQMWGISREKCPPKRFGNLILSVLLVHNSAAESLPFFFVEELEQTGEAQARMLAHYLAGIREG